MHGQHLHEATQVITEMVLNHPEDLPEHLARRLQMRRRQAHALCHRLGQLQWLVRQGSRRQPSYQPGAMRQVVRRYALHGLQEDVAWQQDFAPRLSLPDHVATIAQNLFTELVNNAVDHSGGLTVTVSLRQTPVQLQLLVSDDGCGVFDNIGRQFRIDNPADAMLELAKGKLTSQPQRHTGRGLYFAAKLADVFDLHANGAAFQQRAWQQDQWLQGKPVCRQGTSVFAAVAMDTPRTLDEVLRAHSADGQGYRFERTVVPLALLVGPQRGLESRAMARRVAERLPEFKQVALDFQGLEQVGHAFVDELWRVFASQHPQLRLEPVNMAPRVAAMVDSVRELRAA